MSKINEDDPEELASFRRQWKEEVQQAQRPQAPQQSRSSEGSSGKTVTAPVLKGKALLARGRRLSSSSDKTFVASEGESQEDGFYKPNKKPISALEHYERAVEEETQGSLGDSLIYYRKAFKMDADVHDLYKNKHFPRPKPSVDDPALPSKPIAIAKSALSGKGKEKEVELPAPEPVGPIPATSVLLPSFAGLRIPPIIAPEPLPCPIAALPHEIILQIVLRVSTDIPSFVRLAQVCKSLAWIVYTENSVWKSICARVYPEQIYGPNWAVELNGGELMFEEQLEALDVDHLDDDAANLVPITEDVEDPADGALAPDDEVVKAYKSDFRNMFLLRPRIRYNGVYIATCVYHRPGHSSNMNLTFASPIHIVTYYRYIRFYPNGTLISLLTTAEPAEAVPHFTLLPSATTPAPAALLKDLLPGRWKISPPTSSATPAPGILEIETEGPGPADRYLYEMRLNIKMRPGKKGGGDRLNWEGFWSWNRERGERTKFLMRDDYKPFHFSRVKGIEREIGWNV